MGKRGKGGAFQLRKTDSCWSLADVNSALLVKGRLALLAGLGILIVSS